MRRPIARRRITGARGFPQGRNMRASHAPLRRPLALLYRKQGPARPPAPATIRAADGRTVPLAPRLQIALHLSLTLNEQHHAHHAAAASNGAAHAAQAAAHSQTLETSRHPSADARKRSPLSVARAAARGHKDGASGRQSSTDARRGGRNGALPNSSGQGFLAPATYVGADRDNLALTHADAQLAGATARLAWSARRREQRAPGRAGPSERTNEIALRTSAAGSSGRSFRRSEPPSRAIPTRSPSDTVLAQPQRRSGDAAPLYLAGQPGRSAAADSFSAAWGPPPLVYRSPVPPPAPQPQPEARPAAAAAPAAPSVDIEAVSRDVISRIEKRLRVERERRGRS